MTAILKTLHPIMTTSPPPSPQMPAPSTEWPQYRNTWEASLKAEEPFSVRHRVLLPYIQEALRNLTVRHYLLADEASARIEALQYLEERGRLPESFVAFRILLESALLRFIKMSASSITSDLRDPLAPWHSFRIQVNAERRSFRRYLLAFLPQLGITHPTGTTASRPPGKHWAELWDRLTECIPEACIPSAWREVRAAVRKLAQEQFDFESDLVIPPQRDWKALLAGPLFQAGAVVEARRPGAAHLILPIGALPEDPKRFALDLEAKLQRYGGIPKADPMLKAALEEIASWQTSSVTSATSIASSEMLILAEYMGYSAVRSQTLRSAIEVRANRLQQARTLMEQSLARCTSPSQVGMVLGNISGLLIAEGDYETALHYAQQALQYSPASKVARFNYDKLIQFQKSSYNSRVKNHA
jgi:tetratricopeptide (TPR) repeat protein